MLATVLGLAALGMAAAGATTVIMQRDALDDRVDASLRTEVDEFRAIAAQGGAGSVAQLLSVAITKQAPDRDETFLTLVDGRPQLYPRGERFVALENQPALLAAVRALPPDADVTLQEIDTTAGPIRYAAVRATVPGDTLNGRPVTGTYVVAHSLVRNDRELSALAQRFTLVALASLVVIGGVGWVVAGRLLRPVRDLRATADRISHTDLAERLTVTGTDDVSELAVTFNDMLDRLQQAFEGQQEFLDDAGHELRTPITIVRGHLELMETGDERDVRETRALVLDELDRMARLVHDLILLAKARRPDFLQPAPVDLAVLTEGVVDKARGLGDRTWVVDEAAHETVTADGQRLTQALLQLADNAVKHTAPGATIAIGSAVTGATVRLWVRDDGPGVGPGDRERIFERFGRGASSRRVEGSGLGLSIVSAIAQAHGGTAELEGTSVFVVRFPVEHAHRLENA